MSYKLLAFDLEVLLERLQGGTNFPYGDGDKLLIDRINQTARELLLAEPIAAEISEASVLLEVRRWGTGEKAADLYQAQCIAMLLDGTPVYDHGNALRGSGMALMNTLRDWRNEAKRQQLVQTIEEEAPVYPDPTEPLSRLEQAVREILLEKANLCRRVTALPTGELILRLMKRDLVVQPPAISKVAKSLGKKGCPCRSRQGVGYWLVPVDRASASGIGLERSGNQLADSGA